MNTTYTEKQRYFQHKMWLLSLSLGKKNSKQPFLHFIGVPAVTEDEGKHFPWLIRKLCNTATGKFQAFQAYLGDLHVVTSTMIGRLIKPEFLARCEVFISFLFFFLFSLFLQIKYGSVTQFSWHSKVFMLVFRFVNWWSFLITSSIRSGQQLGRRLRRSLQAPRAHTSRDMSLWPCKTLHEAAEAHPGPFTLLGHCTAAHTKQLGSQ